MFLYISSEDSKELYPSNTVSDFTVELPRVVRGSLLSLHHVYFTESGTANKVLYYVLCDLVEASVVGGKEEQVLGTFYQTGDIITPQPLNVTSQSFKRIRIRILKGDLSVPNNLTSVNFTLKLS